MHAVAFHGLENVVAKLDVNFVLASVNWVNKAIYFSVRLPSWRPWLSRGGQHAGTP
jgi:hypothetical protein